jgi:hypothetical protein
MASAKGAKMEQKNFRRRTNSPNAVDVGADAELERLKQLINVLDAAPHWNALPPSVLQSLNGLEGLKRLAAALTVVFTDYGGTAPWATCESVAEVAPELYEQFGEDRVLALCEEIQYSEIPEQSALLQEMFDSFNLQYFDGGLPDYKILVVYDVWYWEKGLCGSTETLPPGYSCSLPGLMIALSARPPLWVAAVVVGNFSIFHGSAHCRMQHGHLGLVARASRASVSSQSTRRSGQTVSGRDPNATNRLDECVYSRESRTRKSSRPKSRRRFLPWHAASA